jgi:cell pole-organizing protein PopZ
MTQPAKAQEPSMEEILASIRRIIADEEGSKPQPHAASEPTLARAGASSPLPDLSDSAEFRAPAEALEKHEVKPAPVAPVAREIPDTDPEPPGSKLAHAMADSDAPEAAFSDIDDHANENFEDPSMPPAHVARPTAGHLRAIEAPEPLLSAEATAAVNSAFGTLAHTVLVQNARTLEDLVREMLRPMLKTWLDDNLPNLVERLVRAEIARVSRGHPS